MKKGSAPRRSKASVKRAGAIFSRNLRRFCRSKRLTTEAVSKRLGWKQERVERLLAGNHVPGLAVLGHIRKKLNAPLKVLLEGL